MSPRAQTRRVLTLTALAPVLAAVLALSACSTEAQMEAVDPIDPGSSTESPAAEPGELPSAVPAADGPVTTAGLVTVLDDGDGPQLCTFVAESLPPQCEGTPLSGWDWAAHPEHEDQSGTKWGSFSLTGTFDGTTLAVTEAVPAALYDPMSAPPEPALTTPCDPPTGGWGIVDEAMADQEALDATLNAAAALPGYGAAWVDQPVDPSVEAGANDPATQFETLILNVAVTGDVAAAEKTLRETWGGALCVSQSTYTEAELNELSIEVQELPGVESVSASGDVVQVEVLFDDGSLQAWADETYGAGRVEITSTLTPVS
ncbi:hypothetical protein [Nocardioides currus]|uniref:DUF3558 domain-containing protein n=1 Tax=Nocardioides currus TaxID=2133958 RepID=A0A2R7Z189_9ACTN|nr:hypothetical protein [Nocardioides currus]PUA82380.1 hypothetical protein C7S10_01115 [Nocardioides currus]